MADDGDWFGKLLYGLYVLVSYLIGIATFLGAWVYAISRYGLFLGGGLGWIPAFCLGVAAGLLWPVAAIVAWYMLK